MFIKYVSSKTHFKDLMILTEKQFQQENPVLLNQLKDDFLFFIFIEAC